MSSLEEALLQKPPPSVVVCHHAAAACHHEGCPGCAMDRRKESLRGRIPYKELFFVAATTLAGCKFLLSIHLTVYLFARLNKPTRLSCLQNHVRLIGLTLPSLREISWSSLCLPCPWEIVCRDMHQWKRKQPATRAAHVGTWLLSCLCILLLHTFVSICRII